MRRRIGVLLVLALGGCDGGGGATVDGGPRLDSTPPVGSVCDLDNLVGQCPPGSLPIVDEARVEICEGSSEITSEGGAVTGVCRTREACTFICNFSDPCPCGIDRITDEGVFCAACVTACGDARCEGAEDPVRCPIDCAERCPPDAERCNGAHREVCEDNGRWVRLTCRADQRCIFAADPVSQGVTLCETRFAEGGGTFPGLGAWGVGGLDDYSAARFPAVDLVSQPLAFEPDGRLLALNARAQRLEYLDLDGGDPPPVTPIAGRLPTTIEDAYGLHRGREYAIARSRYAGADQVWDLDGSAGTRLLADFGGFPTQADALRGVERGAWAISPDGGTVAHAVAVPFAGETYATIIVWDAATGDVRTLLRYAEPQFGVEPGDLPRLLALSADGSGLVAGYTQADGLVIIRWDVAARRHARPILTDSGDPTAFALSGAGDDRLAIGAARRVEVWDLEAEARLVRVERPGVDLGFSPNGAALIADGAWIPIERPADARALPGAGPVLFDPDAARLVVGRRVFDAGE